MRSKLLGTDEHGGRTFALIFETDDEVSAGLLAFAKEQRLKASHFTGIGACRSVTLGYFDWEVKQYRKLPDKEQVEVLSLIGNVTLAPNGSPQVHAHMVVGRADGSAHGGHLMEAHVRPTLEVFVVESGENLHRALDHDSGIALIKV